MTIMLVLVKICIWILDFYKLEAFGALTGFLELYLWIMAKLLCSCLGLFDIIVVLHANKLTM
jgi:hypothetical protein